MHMIYIKHQASINVLYWLRRKRERKKEIKERKLSLYLVKIFSHQIIKIKGITRLSLPAFSLSSLIIYQNSNSFLPNTIFRPTKQMEMIIPISAPHPIRMQPSLPLDIPVIHILQFEHHR